MTPDHYVVLGVARAQAGWFREVGRWATAAQVPVDFVRCLSVEEVRARLGAGRPHSALLVDAALAGLDRDLVDLATSKGCAVVAVSDGTRSQDWPALGVHAVLVEPVRRDRLLATLREVAHPVSPVEGRFESLPDEVRAVPWTGRLLAVTGAAGSGTSVLAAAIAEGLARDARRLGQVLLADLSLHADQAALHHAGDVVPALQELVEAHRTRLPDADEVRSTTWTLEDRPYRLLLGLRRHRDWALLRPRAVRSTVESLVANWKVVVADVDPDLEGEEDTGSADVEERNLLARTVVARADLVVVTGLPTVLGLRRLVGVLDDLDRHGVDPTRILPVLNRAPRSPRARAELTRALGELTRDRPHASPLFVAERRQVDEAVRDGAPLLRALGQGAANAAGALMERLPQRLPGDIQPVAVVPGSLGTLGPD